ncbi:MAG: phosphoribosylglycinamide formyltransferase [Flavobacteriaceae bacterium]
MKKIALFASGSGTNVENIHRYFKDKDQLIIDSIWTNKPDAGVVNRMADHGYTVHIFEADAMRSGDLLKKLLLRGIDGLVLAGFLLQIPPSFIQAFPQNIINIHPALLPKYGGKGMFGMHVHQAVCDNQEKETGITIHFVNEEYDAGAIIFQTKVSLQSIDTPRTIAQKVQALEYAHFPRIIGQIFCKGG